METIQRNTAFKVWISDLVSGTYGRGEGEFDSGYVEFKGRKVSRVNLVGSVVEKNQADNSLSFDLDDGSGVIRLRVWNENIASFLDVNVGDLVLVVGKVKEYNNFIYVVPEIIKRLDNFSWLKIRKLELTKEFGEPVRVETQQKVSDSVVEEKVSDGGAREVILGLIDKLDFGEGASVDEIVKQSGFVETRKVIDDLLRDGEIFELKEGRLRVMG